MHTRNGYNKWKSATNLTHIDYTQPADTSILKIMKKRIASEIALTGQLKRIFV
jgi:hypothetical protein